MTVIRPPHGRGRMTASGPIGVFDSGVGGLTVLRALRERLPCEDFVYLGDTARMPYGAKTPKTVERYAQEIGQRLLSENVKMLVIACNTATAHGLAALRKRWPSIPCFGVIDPGAAAAAAATKKGRVVVLATEGTVRSGAYQRALYALCPALEVEAIGCNLLAALVEEGWADTPEAEAVIARYIAGIGMTDYDTLVLGCTHFPLLASGIRRRIGLHVSLIDSARVTADVVYGALVERGLANPRGNGVGGVRFLVTDGCEKFRALASLFGQMVADDVRLVTLGDEPFDERLKKRFSLAAS